MFIFVFTVYAYTLYMLYVFDSVNASVERVCVLWQAFNIEIYIIANWKFNQPQWHIENGIKIL